MKYHLLLSAIFLASCALAQDVSLMLQKSVRLSDAERATAWNKWPANTMISFATSDQRFPACAPPNIAQKSIWQVKAWKNEKVHTQILVSSKTNINNVNIAVSNLQDGKGNIISSNNISTGFVQYVMTDEFRDGCGYRVAKDFDSSQVADIINTGVNTISISKNSVQPIWLTVSVPADAVEGNYKGTITITAGKKYTLQIALTVINRTLPAPKDWTFRLDLWQHPAAIARVHNTPLWSDAHYDLMRKYYTMLANAGQKTITASIVDEPWNHQTFDDYPSLVKWTKKKNGEWSFDYSLFDKYISFVMSCGISERINCYSMVPWKVAFKYYDETSGKDTVFTDAIGTTGYNANWSAMLKDFTRHLKEKGWFNITTIAMDERPMDAMKSVIALLKTIDKDWKISLAGEYHAKIENDIYDYCIASKWIFPANVLQARAQQGKASTWYTCCSEKYPNLFTFSPPAEAVWIGWYTAATGMDGYLRWAYNSWPKNSLHDSRFTAWPAGDTYQVYPGPLSSIRFEKTIEGIQDFEKIKILRKEYADNNQKTKLKKMETVLETFTIEKLSSISAQKMIGQGKNILND